MYTCTCNASFEFFSLDINIKINHSEHKASWYYIAARWAAVLCYGAEVVQLLHVCPGVSEASQSFTGRTVLPDDCKAIQSSLKPHVFGIFFRPERLT